MSLWSLFSFNEGRSDLLKGDLGVRPVGYNWRKFIQTAFKRYKKKTKKARRSAMKPSRRFGKFYTLAPGNVARSKAYYSLYTHKDMQWQPTREIKGGTLKQIMKPSMVTVIGVESRGVGFYFLDPKEQEKDGLLTKSVTMTIGTSCVHSVKLENIRNDGSVNFELLQKRKLKNNATKHLVIYGTDPSLVYDRAASLSQVVSYDSFTKKGFLLTDPLRTTWKHLPKTIQGIFDAEDTVLRNQQRYYENTQEFGVDPRLHEFELSAPDYLSTPLSQPAWTGFGTSLNKMKRGNLKSQWAEELPQRFHKLLRRQAESLSTRDDSTFDALVSSATSSDKDGLAVELAQLTQSPEGVLAGDTYIKRMASMSGVQDTRDLGSFQQYKVNSMLYEHKNPNPTPETRSTHPRRLREFNERVYQRAPKGDERMSD